jgi:GT2 family glycosyltransferase
MGKNTFFSGGAGVLKTGKPRPTVSVILPVWNGQSFVADAISSVLLQSFTDFELLVLDDGSDDNSLEICQQFTDPRIRVISHPERQGIVKTLNRGVSMSAGKYIARIDGDDLAVNSRLEKQAQFLEAHSDYGLVGSWMEIFGERKTTLKYPTGDTATRLAMLFDNPFGHPSVMFRRDWEHGGPGYYDEAFAYAEDFEYWVRISALWKCENLPEALTLYRTHPSQSTKSDTHGRAKCVQRIVALQHQALGLKTLPLFPSPLFERGWWSDFEKSANVRGQLSLARIRSLKRLVRRLQIRKFIILGVSALGLAPRARAMRRSWEALRDKCRKSAPARESEHKTRHEELG